MNSITKLILDSGNPDEYRKIKDLAEKRGETLWGATTNPSLIAKNLMGKKVTRDEADRLHRQFVEEILSIVPGAVSAEVYADKNTTGEQMANQGQEIMKWHERIVVKIPTTIEGFKARTILRKKGIPTNNTLVFSQEQVFAIALHEEIMQKEFGVEKSTWLPFISPFVGRLDDTGVNGMDLVTRGIEVKKLVSVETWMLEASVRTVEHMKLGIDAQTELITAPAKIYIAWFELSDEQRSSLSADYTKALSPIAPWTPSDELLSISTIADFTDAIDSNKLNIQHELTDKGIDTFATDWNSAII